MIKDVERLNHFCFPCKTLPCEAKILSASASSASTQWTDPSDCLDADRLSRLDTGPSPFPPDFPKRVNGLKNLYIDHLLAQQDYFKQIRRLEGQFNRGVLERLDAEERTIISGESSPKGGAALDTEKRSSSGKGIADFWLTVLHNVNSVTKLIQSWDIPVLRFLVDVRQSDVYVDLDPQGFKLEFEFAENPFFTNKNLSRTFYLKYDYSTKRELIDASTTGLQISHSVGTEIVWKNEHFTDITHDIIVPPKPRCRTIAAMKKEPVKYRRKLSFFHFFDTDEPTDHSLPPTSPLPTQESRNDKPSQITLGLYFRDYILPEKVAIFLQ